METWVGVITNVGSRLMANWTNGSVINIDKAVAGTGIASTISLLAQTDLVAKKQNASIVSSKAENDTQIIKIQITAPEEKYILNQIGLLASLNGGEPVLLALFQNEEGISMPSASESPDFLYTFYGKLKVSNQCEFSCTFDSSAYVSQSSMEEYVGDQIAFHNTDPAAHSDLRKVLEELSDAGEKHPDPAFTSTKSVPSNSAPYAEVKEIGGMTHRVNVGTEEAPEYVLHSTPVTKVESVGVNLFGGDVLADKLVEAANATKDVAAGTVTYFRGDIVGKVLFDNFKPNTQYTFILYGSVSTSSYTNLRLYYADGTFEEVRFEGGKEGIPHYAKILRNGSRYLYSAEGKTITKLAGYNQSGYVTFYYDKCGIFEGVLTEADFVPCVRNTLPIPEAIQNLDGYGWGINESIYNYVDFDKKQFVKRVGCVDMGTLTWGLKDGATSVFYSWDLRNIAKEYGALLCSKYDVGTSTEVYEKMTMDKAVCVGSPSYIGVADSAYTDGETLKAALSGVMLYYELATPVITDISDLLPDDNLIGVEGGGTITMVNEYGYDVPNTIDFYLGKNEVIAADTLVGDLVGTASRAVCDKDGNPISSSYAKYADANGSLKANASGQSPSESVLRNSTLVTAETNPTVNGEICWTLE